MWATLLIKWSMNWCCQAIGRNNSFHGIPLLSTFRDHFRKPIDYSRIPNIIIMCASSIWHLLFINSSADNVTHGVGNVRYLYVHALIFVCSFVFQHFCNGFGDQGRAIRIDKITHRAQFSWSVRMLAERARNVVLVMVNATMNKQWTIWKSQPRITVPSHHIHTCLFMATQLRWKNELVESLSFHPSQPDKRSF